MQSGTARGGNSTNLLYLLVGALIVAVGVLGYLYYDSQQNEADITIQLPAIDAE